MILRNLSSSTEGETRIMKEGAVPQIVTLLRSQDDVIQVRFILIRIISSCTAICIILFLPCSSTNDYLFRFSQLLCSRAIRRNKPPFASVTSRFVRPMFPHSSRKAASHPSLSFFGLIRRRSGNTPQERSTTWLLLETQEERESRRKVLCLLSYRCCATATHACKSRPSGRSSILPPLFRRRENKVRRYQREPCNS